MNFSHFKPLNKIRKFIKFSKFFNFSILKPGIHNVENINLKIFYNKQKIQAMKLFKKYKEVFDSYNKDISWTTLVKNFIDTGKSLIIRLKLLNKFLEAE